MCECVHFAIAEVAGLLLKDRDMATVNCVVFNKQHLLAIKKSDIAIIKVAVLLLKDRNTTMYL